MKLHDVFSHLRTLLPDVYKARCFVHTLPRPLDPTLHTYITQHLNLWDFEVITHTGHNPHNHSINTATLYQNDLQLFGIIHGRGANAPGTLSAEIVQTSIQNTAHSIYTHDFSRFNNPLPTLLQHAHRTLSHAAQSQPEPSAATAALFLIHQNTAYTSHVGDARIYRIRNQTLTQITQDHSLASILQQANQPYPSTLANTIIVQALGIDPPPQPSHSFLNIEPNDTFFLSTSTLHQHLPTLALDHALTHNPSQTLQERKDTLLNLARQYPDVRDATFTLIHIRPHSTLPT